MPHCDRPGYSLEILLDDARRPKQLVHVWIVFAEILFVRHTLITRLVSRKRILDVAELIGIHRVRFYVLQPTPKRDVSGRRYNTHGVRGKVAGISRPVIVSASRTLRHTTESFA